MLYPYGFVPYSLKFSSVYLPYLLVNVCWNHGWHRYHGYTVLFWNPKLVHSISIHFIRVICGGSIRDEKQHIPDDFSILPVNGYNYFNIALALHRGHTDGIAFRYGTSGILHRPPTWIHQVNNQECGQIG